MRVPNGYLLGAQLSWTVLKVQSDLEKQNKVERTVKKLILELEQYVAKSELEINQAKRQLADAKHQFETAQLSEQQAKEYCEFEPIDLKKDWRKQPTY